jgi:hypothetical protein
VYALHLDPASRAWEYLRRNPHYVRDWVRYRRRASHGIAARWGLEVLVDPQLDARQVSPVWAIDALSPVMLVRDETESPRKCEIAAERFSLWRLAGRKVLFEGDDGLRLATHILGRDVGLRLGDYLCDGDRFAYQIPAVADERAAWSAVTAFRWLTVACEGGQEAFRRPGRAALFHARALQVLDGLAAGAAQRELAVALFGSAAVARGWQPDAALRAQVRYLIRRARALMAGEYRTLIDPDRPDPVSQDVPRTKATSHNV